MASRTAHLSQDERWTEIGSVSEQYRHLRGQRYTSINVLLLYWKDSDLPTKEEADALKDMFTEHFNYLVHPFEIPLVSSGIALNSYLKHFLDEYGNSDEKLVLIHYGGHGERTVTWAANLDVNGPSLDWSEIQPQLFLASCDIGIILDCCYAGQSSRARSSSTVEFLAAANKDEWTPRGDTSKWPSFTKVLIREMIAMLKRDRVVNFPDLCARMQKAECGLAKQPIYVPLAKGSAGKIQLRRKVDVKYEISARDMMGSWKGQGVASRQFLVSVSRPLDDEIQMALERWITKDSPNSIADIKIIKDGLSEAQAVSGLGKRLLREDSVAKSVRGPFLPDQASGEVARLLKEMKDILSQPAPQELRDDEALAIFDSIKGQSGKLVTVLEDCLAELDIGELERMKAWDLSAASEIRTRIALRLTLLDGGQFEESSAVIFDNQSQGGQRFRIGKQDGVDVLVEYCPHESMTEKDEELFTRQISRVSALHLEEKPAAFRTLPGRGFMQEARHDRRFGFIFQLPENRSAHRYSLLYDLIKQGKTVPLDVRTHLASALCEALLHLHSIGWLHKGIKSENILVLGKDKPSGGHDLAHELYDFKNPYLVGFDCSRPADAETKASVNFSREENLYRHPDRWGRPARFERQHDLYALGILLLEIGRWKLFPSMDPAKKNFENLKDPEKLRDILLGSVCAQLAHAAGSTYADATRVCVDRRSWIGLEDWQFQRIVRNKVLRPLCTCT